MCRQVYQTYIDLQYHFIKLCYLVLKHDSMKIIRVLQVLFETFPCGDNEYTGCYSQKYCGYTDRHLWSNGRDTHASKQSSKWHTTDQHKGIKACHTSTKLGRNSGLKESITKRNDGDDRPPTNKLQDQRQAKNC